ncbi:MAG: ATP-binding protein [Methylovirgula sp.]|uniref:ATP-binding protein n=1 Tax=Methylovirgula sp. TaxID=1978224 RepID=UPI0030768010
MASELDALWSEFAAETEDHLDSLSRLLSDHVGDWSPAEIGALFRYFHSLKGTFLAMGFNNVEAVAHHCEDILSLVREGRAGLGDSSVRVLLRAADTLKSMRDNVLATREDARPAVDLISELETYVAIDKTQEAISPTAVPQSIALHDDAEMLGIYSELLEQRLPSTAQALSEFAGDRAAATETCSELAHGAGMMGFDALSGHLETLAVEATAGTSDRARLVYLLGEIRERVKTIEELTGNRSGADLLAEALIPQLKPDYSGGLDALEAAAISGLSAVGDMSVSVRVLAMSQGFEWAGRLLLLLEEASHVGMQRYSDETKISHLIKGTVNLLRHSLDTGADITANQSDVLAARWAEILRAGPGDTSLEDGLAARLSPEFLETLSLEQHFKLEKAIADGNRLYEVSLDLERNPDIAADVLGWLSAGVQSITSHTALHRGADCFDFLIASEHPLDWISSETAALDPEGFCLRGVREFVGAVPVASVQVNDVTPIASLQTPLIRVPSQTIDDLMAEIGEMRSSLAALAEILQNGEIARATRKSGRSVLGTAADNAIWREYIGAVDTDLYDIRALRDKLEGAHHRIWDVGLKLRVIPIDGLFGRLSRAARDLAEKLGKEINVVVEGREVRVDKSVVDLLTDPLMHMVRNAIDHGIEAPALRAVAHKHARATLTIAALESGNHVEIIIADDGRGLDRSKITAKAIRLGIISADDAERMTDDDVDALIFRAGVSTADSVTEVSGRGVGLDVVQGSLQRLGGTIEVRSSSDIGTKFTLKLPISAALLRTLLVEVDNQIFALPERQVIAVREAAANEIEVAGGRSVTLHGETQVPLYHLRCALGFAARPLLPEETVHMVIVLAGTNMLGLRVDRILTFQDLFLKELHPVLAMLPAVVGAAVLGDGRPVLVLDPRSLAGTEMINGNV